MAQIPTKIAVQDALATIRSLGGFASLPDTCEWLDVRDYLRTLTPRAVRPDEWQELAFLIDEACVMDGFPPLCSLSA